MDPIVRAGIRMCDKLGASNFLIKKEHKYYLFSQPSMSLLFLNLDYFVVWHYYHYSAEFIYYDFLKFAMKSISEVGSFQTRLKY